VRENKNRGSTLYTLSTQSLHSIPLLVNKKYVRTSLQQCNESDAQHWSFWGGIRI